MDGIEFFLNVPGKRTDVVTSHIQNVSSAVQQALGPDILPSEYYIIHNGRIVGTSDDVQAHDTYQVFFKVLGGKGGFGSMLRSIGAQIEKTTNREACRDLSGRRMRDVNNEKKLREWAAKTDEREREREEKKKERRERMKAPRYKFDDPTYEQQRTAAADMLEDALQQGLKKSSAVGKGKSKSSGKGKGKAIKRRAVEEDDDDDDDDIDAKKMKELLGMDIEDSDHEGASSSHKTSAVECSSAASSSHSTATTSGCSSGGSSPSSSSSSNEAKSSDSKIKSSSSSSNEAKSSGGKDKSSTETVVSSSCSKKGSQSSENNSGTQVLQQNRDQRDQEQECDIEKREEAALALKNAQQAGESLDLEAVEGIDELLSLGLDVLKFALMSRGIKCGGSLEERAKRLFSVRGLKPDQIPTAIRAKPPAKKNKN